MHKRTLLPAIALLLPLSTAHADDHDGLGIGPRREGYASGLGIDLRRGDNTFSVFLSAYGARSPNWKADSMAASFGLQHVVAAHGRAELSVGARVGVHRDHQEQGDAEVTYDQLAVQVPLRITLWVTDHVSLFTEVGVEATRTHATSTWTDPTTAIPVVGDDTNVTGGLFGAPLMNFGLTYGF